MLKEIKNFYNKIKILKYSENPENEEIPITHTKIFYKEYPRLPSIRLPEIEEKDSEFETLLDYRGSQRIFSDTPLELKEISKVLGSCRMVKGNFSVVDNPLGKERRTYPSGGARFPVELYLLSYNIKDLEEGAYHYNIKENSLEQLLKKDLKSLRRGIISPYLENSAASIIFTSVISRSEIKYGLKAYPFSLIEAGHMGQNIQLASSEIGLGSCPVSGFVDTTIQKILDLTENEIPIYSINIGHIKRY